MVLTLAKRIALKNGATIYLTHVFRPMLKINSPEQLNIFKDEQFIIDIKRQFSNGTFTLMQVNANSVREGLNEYVSKEKANLLVLANQKRDWLSNILNPSLSKAMVLDSQTPLLVCHLDEDA